MVNNLRDGAWRSRHGHGLPGTSQAMSGGGRRPVRHGRLLGWITALVWVCALVLPGCETPPSAPVNAPGGAPAPTYTGPAYLRGTIGSLARLRSGSERPLLVSGYGIVVNLNGTGSTSVPAPLRLALINQMRKYGLGSASMDTLHMTPERVLADPNTAVVRIDGLIPPGATPGLRFDVLVTAVDSQTTSLAGGTLWTAELGINGANAAFKFMHEQATAYGPIYDNPYHDQPSTGEPKQFGQLQAMVVAGGKTTAPRSLELVLNQSSYTRSRGIADRINERFGKTTDRKPLAKPMTDQLIKIHVPPRYQANPAELVDLLMHMYMQTGPGFEPQQAQMLAQVLQDDPQTQWSVRLAWQALGRPVVEVLRGYYGHGDLQLRLSALEAGAWLGDERASHSLADLAIHEDPAVRARVARALVMLPRSLKGSGTLKDLLDDQDTVVRVTAYESLAAINDRLITTGRVSIPDASGTGLKYVIDAVPAEKPLVYISQVGVPRIVIFSPDLGFKAPLLARLWDNRLMLTMRPEQTHLDVFYQPASLNEPDAPSSVTLKARADLKTLVYLLGHKPTLEQPNLGLGMTYSQVVDVVYQLCKQGDIPASIEVVASPLAKQIADLENTQIKQLRPETGPEVVDEQPVGRLDADGSPDDGQALTTRPDSADDAQTPKRTSSR